MTYWHMFNTAALVFLPPYLMFRARLQEFCPFGPVIWSGFFFVATEFVQVCAVARASSPPRYFNSYFSTCTPLNLALYVSCNFSRWSC